MYVIHIFSIYFVAFDRHNPNIIVPENIVKALRRKRCILFGCKHMIDFRSQFHEAVYDRTNS